MEGLITRRDSCIIQRYLDKSKARSGGKEQSQGKAVGIYKVNMLGLYDDEDMDGLLPDYMDGIDGDNNGLYGDNNGIEGDQSGNDSSVVNDGPLQREDSDDGLEAGRNAWYDNFDKDWNSPRRERSLLSDKTSTRGQDGVKLGNTSVSQTNVVCARLVAEAKKNFILLKNAVALANKKLVIKREPASTIAEDLMVDIEVTMVDGIQLLVDFIHTRDQNLDDLRQSCMYYKDENRRITQQLVEAVRENAHLQKDIGKEAKAGNGMDQRDIKKMEYMGYKSVGDLVNAHLALRDKLKLMDDNQLAGSVKSVSRITPAASVASSISKAKNVHLDGRKVKEKMDGGNRGMTFKDKKDVAKSKVLLPMPKVFTGRTRTELERFFRLFEASSESYGWSDGDRALYLGSYLPKLALHHDSLYQRNASYAEMKKELLNALGSDSSVAKFTIRAELDRMKEPTDKPYKDLFDELETKVIEAYGGDSNIRENELKKILLRLTEEDSDQIYRATILPHVEESYYRLKEFVLGIESSRQLQKKNESKLEDNERAEKNRRRQWQEPQRMDRYAPHPGGYRNLEQRDTVISKDGDAGSYRQREQVVQSYSNDGSFTGICSSCHTRGHTARFCPNGDKPVMQVKRIEDVQLSVTGIVPVGSVVSDRGDSVPMVGKQTLLDIVFDGVKINAMLDTGACVSVIKDTVLMNVLKEQRCKKLCQGMKDEKPETFIHARLVGADGRALKVVNCIRVPIAWGNHRAKYAKFFVVEGLQQNILIGTNILDSDEWIKALQVALKRDSAPNVCGYKSIGLIMPQNIVKVNRDCVKSRDDVKSRGHGIDADSWRRGNDADCHQKSNATTFGKHDWKEKQLISHPELHKKKDVEKHMNRGFNKKKQADELNRSRLNDRSKLPKVYGRRVFYNQSFYRGLNRKPQNDRNTPLETSTIKERTSTVRDKKSYDDRRPSHASNLSRNVRDRNRDMKSNFLESHHSSRLS